MNALIRQFIRTDGTVRDLPGTLTNAQIRVLIGADALDAVSLRHLGDPLHVMLLDDTGAIEGKPINIEATRLYHANCKPGVTAPICGDVVVVPDSDFA